MVEEHKMRLNIACDVDEVLTYALIRNGGHFVNNISLTNKSDVPGEHIIIRVTSASALIEDYAYQLDRVEAGETFQLRNPEIQVNVDMLASFTEGVPLQLKLVAEQNGEVIASNIYNVRALAFDEWPGLLYTPELMASFVMPNHPVVTNMLQLAAKYMNKWTGSPSLAGYQMGDPDYVKKLAAAAYAAIQQTNITYAEPPASFEAMGQRVRLPDAVIEQHFGTCMDMSLLYAGCLEAMGLNALLIMMRGHIFAGVWLSEESFTDMIMDDPSQLEKRMSKGIEEITLVECTAMCAGRSRGFDDAVTMARKQVKAYGDFAFAIDVRRARSMGVRPLPVRMKTAEGFRVEHEERKSSEVTGASGVKVEQYDLPDSFQKNKVTKQAQWERKMLDLSLRNLLINMRMTRAVIPLLSPDLGLFEDALADGEEFRVLPRPKDMVIKADEGIPVEALCELGAFKDFIALESKHKRIHSLYTPKELQSCLKAVYRSAKSSLEENGASTLYLSLGALRWFESGKDAAPRYAPLVLLPIEIIRKSAGDGYAMRMRDEDAQINITVLEFLKQNYNLQIPGLNPPPVDEHGLDIPKIFAIVRHAIMHMPMWDVVEIGLIGNFSFSQFVMWNDIHGNGDFLTNNKIVKSLIDGAVKWDTSIPENLDKEEAYLPVTVDASQLRAVNLAAGDASFVLHGPPGTGKSQTITAMIANALTKGKSVLFVAEKMAALEVVQKRLTALGIGDFCLELHSNKATKKAVLDQLKRGLELAVDGEERKYEEKIQDIRRMRRELDAYREALHKMRPYGCSLRELIEKYEAQAAPAKSIALDAAYVSQLTESDVNHQVQNLEYMVAAGRSIGHPHNHALSAVRQTEYSQKLKFELLPVVQSYRESLGLLQKEAGELVSEAGLAVPESRADWAELVKLVQAAERLQDVPEFLQQAGDLDEAFDVAETYLLKQQEFTAKEKSYLAKWNDSFLHQNMNLYKEKYNQAADKFILFRGSALRKVTAELQAFAKFELVTDEIPAYLVDVEYYQREAEAAAQREEQLPYGWKKLLEKYSTRELLQEYKGEIKNILAASGSFGGIIRQWQAQGRLTAVSAKGSRFKGAYEAAMSLEEKLTAMLMLDFSRDNEAWLPGRLALCECLSGQADSLKDWIIYRQYNATCRQMGLAAACEAYEKGLAHEDVVPVYLHSLYQTIILHEIEAEPVLNGFTGIGFNEKIKQFKKMDEEFMQLTKDEMRYQLTRRLPVYDNSVEVSRELNILRRAITSNGRGISIRSLFEQIPHVLWRLCPCMLMSPISVAQYMKAENDLVDIVIFDEASQLPTCKAVGALARGKNAVVVGDPKQMPPTSFFAGNTVDEDNLDIEDLDSILDDCLALGMPSSYLQWHYRSQHESLIAFSNREFYENNMLTFPSVNDREKCVKLVKVKGYFDRGKSRVNDGEARAIVAEILRRYKNPELRQKSIGVVTFNINQQNYIEDLLQLEYQKDVDFDIWANSGSEALFVKNLENVQGDERDVIMFSISFGPDAEGKLSMNFGPMNKDGGWKRLNVAVSRARAEMLVFTTMSYEQIDLRRTKAKGVEAMKNFLEFAEKGFLPGEREGGKKQQGGIFNKLCDALTANGYEYQVGVGHSRFKIDLAVINPYEPDKYLLAVMLDGDNYKQSANTRDREIAQPSVLQHLGWQLYRLWTMDWWDNPQRELEKLLRCLDEKKQAAALIAEAKAAEAAENAEPVPDTEPEDVTEAGADETAAEETVEEAIEPEPLPEVESDVVSSYEGNDNLLRGGVALDEKPEPQAATVEAITTDAMYKIEAYAEAEVDEAPLNSTEYIKPENQPRIVAVMQQILAAEAPISQEKLIKKTLRACGIARSSSKTLDASEKAVGKIGAVITRQNGMKFYWRRDQNPEEYFICRNESAAGEKRSGDDFCQQELKNAVCLALLEGGPMDKDTLLKATVRVMGYARTTQALLASADRGLKYARKINVIMLNEEKMYELV